MSKSKGADCPYRRLADSLREKKGVAWATAKLEDDDGDGTYVEFFRGKDFACYFRANPEKMDDLVQPTRPGRTVEDQIRDLMHFFVNKGLALKTERKYKRPKPGKKRLVKWPRTIETCQDQSWDEKAFYSWQYDRPTSIWYYIGTAALPVLVLLACLFPLAPWWMRMAFIYFLMALLSALLGLITVRYLLFSFVWMATGHSLWLFPNMMSDEVSVIDAFTPVIYHSKPDKKKPSQWKSRMVTAALSAGVFYVLYMHSPNVDHLKEEAARAHESLIDYLDLYSRGKGFLGDGNATRGAAEPLYQQATAQRGGPGYDPTGGKARASQKMREDFERQQAELLLKKAEEEAKAKAEAAEGADAARAAEAAMNGEGAGAGEGGAARDEL